MVLLNLLLLICINLGQDYVCLCFALVPTLFLPDSVCLSLSYRCSTGSATTRSCSCRVIRRSEWATNTPSTYRHSIITLLWIPWWVQRRAVNMDPVGARVGGGGLQVFFQLKGNDGPMRREELKKVRAGVWQQDFIRGRTACCFVHPAADIRLFPWFKTRPVLWHCLHFGRQIQYF